MVTLQDLIDIANTARGEEAKEVYKILRNLLVIVKANLRVERSLGEFEAKQQNDAPIAGVTDAPGTRMPITSDPTVLTSPEFPASGQVIEIPPVQAVEIPQAVVSPVLASAPAKPSLLPKVPAKKPAPKSSKEAVSESISRLLRLPQPEKPDIKSLLPIPFEIVITDEELPPNTYLAAPYRQVKTREDVLGILDSFVVLGWGACAECSKDLCMECKDGGIRVKMNFCTLTGTTFTGTAWKSQIALLLRCSVNRLIEVWVERPEEINARFSEYLGRPFHVTGIVKDFQGLTYSVNALTCLHWGAVNASLDQRANESGGEVS